MTYLLDTNVISELRKHSQANSGVQEFLQTAIEQEARIYISVITLGELRRGVELMRHRGDHLQANLLERWLQTVVDDYADHILDFTITEAQVWGSLCVPHSQNAIDKQPWLLQPWFTDLPWLLAMSVILPGQGCLSSTHLKPHNKPR
jgi:predicted nucleic acid-binding protein